MTDLLAQPLFGVTATIAAYALGRATQRRFPAINTLVISCGLLIALLLLAKIPYASYKIGGDYIAFLLGPATVALAVPLYKNARTIRAQLLPVLTAIFVGSLMGIVSIIALVSLTHGSDLLLRSILAKSVTTPISIELARFIGGREELAAISTCLAGLTGATFGVPLLKLLRIRHPLAMGAAMGTSCHGIGTARLVQESPLHTGTSALALAACGIFTSLLFIPLRALLS